MFSMVSWRKKTRFRDRQCVLDGVPVVAGEEAVERDYRGRVICLCDQCYEEVKRRIQLSSF